MSKKNGRKLPNKAQISTFTQTVVSYWRSSGRHDLPWRDTENPYKILVSEVMLQQTQVPRVLPKYESFLKKFPTQKSLSKAPLATVIKEWSGLGYNRRAKYLREAARAIQKDHHGVFPRTYEALRKLPGVGDYTAKAILVFAFDQPEFLIETNIRTVLAHHFYASHTPKTKIKDSEFLELAERVGKEMNPREWHWALMDYGAHLKANGIRLNTKSAHYARQSRFEGSLREVRGAILRSLGFSSTNEESLEAELEFPRDRFLAALEGLFKDGLIEEKDGILRLALN